METEIFFELPFVTLHLIISESSLMLLKQHQISKEMKHVVLDAFVNWSQVEVYVKVTLEVLGSDIVRSINWL
jgi:glyoxylate carboligase